MRAPFVFAMQLILTLAMGLVGCSKGGPGAIHAKSMPAGGTFTGVWFSPEYGEMHMRQNGASVIGRYSKDERTGRLQGHVEGDLMRFEWTEERELIAGRKTKTKGHGYFRIAYDDGDKTFKLKGEWGHDAAERGGGPWTAVRSRTMKPRLDAAGNETDSSDEESSGSDSESGDDYSGKDANDIDL